jgi:hypothetical protein
MFPSETACVCYQSRLCSVAGATPAPLQMDMQSAAETLKNVLSLMLLLIRTSRDMINA